MEAVVKLYGMHYIRSLHLLCNICSTVGRSIADISDPRWHIYRGTKVNMPSRSDIEAIDQPTVLSILYSTISVQQTNLLSENASQNDTIFPKSRYHIYQTASQCFSSYGCTVIVLYALYNLLSFLQILARGCTRSGGLGAHTRVHIHKLTTCKCSTDGSL